MTPRGAVDATGAAMRVRSTLGGNLRTFARLRSLRSPAFGAAIECPLNFPQSRSRDPHLIHLRPEWPSRSALRKSDRDYEACLGFPVQLRWTGARPLSPHPEPTAGRAEGSPARAAFVLVAATFVP